MPNRISQGFLRGAAAAAAMPLLFALALPVSAQLDATRQATDLRAGPDAAFPVVMRLPAMTHVHVLGCTVERRWCDVAHGRIRGWVRRDALPQSPRVNDAPTVTFSVAEYWDAHYTRRPWYSQRGQWLAWGTPGFRAPPARTR